MGNLQFTGPASQHFWFLLHKIKRLKHVNSLQSESKLDRFILEVNLLSKQLVVHLDPLHLFVTLLQSLVTLTELSDVVASFGQDASFTLRNTAHRRVNHH